MKNTDKELIPAVTNRYLYHLTYKYNRESILKHGLNLRKSYKKWKFENFNARLPVFSHNTDILDNNWYWLMLDWNEGKSILYEDFTNYLTERDYLRLFVNTMYDIWKIDNHIINKTWYVDEIGWSDNPYVKDDYYIKCFGIIPPNALTICTLDIEVDMNRKIAGKTIHNAYYNPIITRAEYLKKFGFEPEQEVIIKDMEFKNEAYHLTLGLCDDEINPYKHKWKQIAKSTASFAKAA